MNEFIRQTHMHIHTHTHTHTKTHWGQYLWFVQFKIFITVTNYLRTNGRFFSRNNSRPLEKEGMGMRLDHLRHPLDTPIGHAHCSPRSTADTPTCGLRTLTNQLPAIKSIDVMLEWLVCSWKRSGRCLKCIAFNSCYQGQPQS